MLCRHFLIFYFRAGCLVLKSLNAMCNRLSNAVQWRFVRFFVSLNLKIGLCVFVNMNSTNSWQVYIVSDFKDLKKSFQLRGIWSMRQDEDGFLISINVYFGMSGLFFLSQRTLVSSSCRSIQTWVIVWYSAEDATENLKFSPTVDINLVNCDFSS